jgi:hypothetical protein
VRDLGGGHASGSGPDAPRGERELPTQGEPPIDRRPELLADARRRARIGAIELIAVIVVVAALVALAVWFFAFAHNPLLHP